MQCSTCNHDMQSISRIDAIHYCMQCGTLCGDSGSAVAVAVPMLVERVRTLLECIHPEAVDAREFRAIADLTEAVGGMQS